MCCSEWKELITWPQEENGGPVAFTKDGKSVYVQSSLGYDTTRLLQVCLPLPIVTPSCIAIDTSMRFPRQAHLPPFLHGVQL